MNRSPARPPVRSPSARSRRPSQQAVEAPAGVGRDGAPGRLVEPGQRLGDGLPRARGTCCRRGGSRTPTWRRRAGAAAGTRRRRPPPRTSRRPAGRSARWAAGPGPSPAHSDACRRSRRPCGARSTAASRGPTSAITRRMPGWRSSTPQKIIVANGSHSCMATTVENARCRPAVRVHRDRAHPAADVEADRQTGLGGGRPHAVPRRVADSRTRSSTTWAPRWPSAATARTSSAAASGESWAGTRRALQRRSGV